MTHLQHDHGHHHHHHHGQSNLALAFWLNTAFALIELVGGFYTSSVAVMSDALHDLGDSLALGTAWWFEKKSKKLRDETYTYGYRRFSLVGALINAVVLLVGSFFILVEAVKRFIHPVHPDTGGMILLALLGIAVNGIALVRLRKGPSISEKVIALHFVEDVVGWVAVLFGSIIMRFVHAPFIDPLLSVAISVYIIFNVFRNVQGALRIILQGVPPGVSEEQVVKELTGFPEVADTHDVHLWTMDGRYNIVTAHIVIRESLDFRELEDLKARLKSRMREINVQHTTIEFETMDTCCGNHPEDQHLADKH
jgi:cobalt-zinc-cadmium efflux system protein